MPTEEAHAQRCVEVLGEPLTGVHRWLDEFCGQPPWGTRHRHLRHHREGIEQVRRLWGARAALAAEFHIRQDLDAEGWPKKRPIPKHGEARKKARLW